MEPINLFCIKNKESKIYQNSSGKHYCERCFNIVTNKLSAENKEQIGYTTVATTHTLAYLTQAVYTHCYNCFKTLFEIKHYQKCPDCYIEHIINYKYKKITELRVNT